MPVSIPNIPRGLTTRITLISSAVEQKPYLGGPTQRIKRLGDRWSYEVQAQPMSVEQAGPITAALLQGLSEKVIARVFTDGFDYAPYSTGTVVGSYIAGSNSFAFTGTPAPKVGQFLSLVIDEVRYLHQVIAVDGSTATVQPSLKKPLAGGETIELGEPKIEGFIEGQEQSFDVGMVANLGITFRIIEAQ